MKIKSWSLMAGVAVAVFSWGMVPAWAENWIFMGEAATGEDVYVDADSISRNREGLRFTYSIGGETIYAIAYCHSRTWYAARYDQVYSPSSYATHNMINYVCSQP